MNANDARNANGKRMGEPGRPLIKVHVDEAQEDFARHDRVIAKLREQRENLRKELRWRFGTGYEAEKYDAEIAALEVEK